MKKRILSLFLAVLMVLGMAPPPAQTVEGAERTGIDTDGLTFDVAKPAGYVTISFEDYGVRPEDDYIEELYQNPLGEIIPATQVPFEEGENMAEVTVRLLNALNIGCDYTGTIEDGFYLAGLEDFELNGTHYEYFGEFDAGPQSGWMVRLNDWYMNQGCSAFQVEDGDTIRWVYTCQLGADIGGDFNSKSAEIKAVKLTDESLALVPGEEEGSYTCVVPEELSSIAFEVELENYSSQVTVRVDGKEERYRPNQEIPVTSTSQIVISTKLEYMDPQNNNQVTVYTDSVTIQLQPEVKNQGPVVADNAPDTLEAAAGEEFSVDLSQFFSDADGDPLAYTVKIAELDLEQTLDGSVYAGTIPQAGTYTVVITASDGTAEASHTVSLRVSEASGNRAPQIQTEYAEEKGKTYLYGGTYVYIYMDEIFEDPDGDELTYSATLDGEPVDLSYNSFSGRYYILFSTKPAVCEYKITASDGNAQSEVFTARCIGTSATVTPGEGEPLIASGNTLYYIKGTAEDDTFSLDFALDVDAEVETGWESRNPSALTANGDGTFTAGDVDSRQNVTVYVTSTAYSDSTVYLGSVSINILPAMPEVADVTAELAEHADLQKPAEITNAFTGWYATEFTYEIEDPSICSIATKGTYGLSITPLALGTTKVTATFKYDPSIQCTFPVTVTGRSLQIAGQPGEDSVIFEEGKQVQLQVLGAEEGETFTWSSADETVATVDAQGLVTVRKPGQTYLTAVSSRSTAEKPVRASLYLQVKEEGKAYLDDLALTQYSYFGHASAKAGFNAAQLEYDWEIEENRYTYATLAFTPYFDGESLTAVLRYRTSEGAEQEVELTDGAAVNIANVLASGENVVTIEVYPTGQEDNVTTYTFRIFRPYNPTCTVSGMTLYPNGETALAYPTYLGYKEGTLFRYDEETEELATGSTGKPLTGWSNSVTAYKTYIYGSRTTTLSLSPRFGSASQRAMIYVDGEPLEEAVTNWKSSPIKVGEKGAVITLRVNSEKYHAEQVAAGAEDPFANPEKEFRIYVESVEPLGIDAKILSAEVEGGTFYAPGFQSDRYTLSALIPSGETEADLTFTVPEGIQVYKTSVTDANLLEPSGADEEGNPLYTTPILPITGTGSNARSTTNIILQVEDGEGNTGTSQYAFTVYPRGEKDVYPDRVVEYLCIGSQYTNASNYGTMPERTLKDGGGVLSVGNFGGYIIYQYEKPIENDPKNPYGADFIVYGNAFGTGAHEPGYVQVSQDGETWYTLAGSDHYEDYNDWDYSMTYTNRDGKSAWTNSDGESGENYNYPQAASYPYFDWTEEREQSMTVTGPRLNSNAEDNYGSAAAVFTDFGYADVNTNGTINSVATNPYNHPDTVATGGDAFDLSWAVDENGMPVELDSVSYIRIATASSIYAGAIGEKSTEITAVNRVTNPAEAPVGQTQAPESLVVNGQEVALPENGGVVRVSLAEGQEEGEALTVRVNAPEDANIYINSENGEERIYSSIPEKGLIRVIVQEGEKEPYICYLQLTEPEEPAPAPDTDRYLSVLLDKVPEPEVTSIGGEWAVLALARAGYEVPEDYYAHYYEKVVEALESNEGVLPDSRNKSTEYSRVILALTALGYDVTDVAGYNLLANLTDMGYVTRQGINGPIWALIALDSHDYAIPDSDAAVPVTREKLIANILGRQLEDGGWALSGTTADPDMTAMALQALAPYCGTDSEVKAAADKAVECLSKLQRTDGGFASWGTVNAESTAQVIVALSSLGINPAEDPRFVKEGGNPVTALLSFTAEEGGFQHTADGGYNQMATEQGTYALVAYERLLEQKNTLYDMSDVTIRTEPDTPEPEEPEEGNVTLPDVNGGSVTVTGKEGVLDGLVLEVTILSSGNRYDQAAAALPEGKFALYDMYLLENNLEVQPDGPITVSIPLPEGYEGTRSRVYLMNEDGSMAEIPATLADGKLVFETSQIGAFAVFQPAEANPDDGQANPGDDTGNQPGDNTEDNTGNQPGNNTEDNTGNQPGANTGNNAGVGTGNLNDTAAPGTQNAGADGAGTVKTGDNSLTGMYVVVFLGALAAVSLLSAVSRKKNRR